MITEDHFGMVDGHQHTYENYHWVPSHGEWVNYYTGRMPTGGSLVRMKHHVHMNLLDRAFWFATSAARLGLHARPIGPDGGEMGSKEIPGAFFSHGGSLGKLLFDGTDTHVDFNTWPVGVVSVKQLGATSLADFSNQLLERARALDAGGRLEATLVCTLSRGNTRVADTGWPKSDGFLWDRAGRSDCRAWRFRRGDECAPRASNPRRRRPAATRRPARRAAPRPPPGRRPARARPAPDAQPALGARRFTSVSLLQYHGERVGPWSPDRTPPRLPSHNQWNLYFEADDGASHYFLYSALIHDPTVKLRRYVLRELLLMMNWRIVAANAPLATRLQAASMSVRRLAPLTLLALLAGAAALGRLGCRRWRRRKVHEI